MNPPLKMLNQSETLKKLMPYLFWAALGTVTYLLLMELPPSKSSLPHADKIIHATLFLVLSAIGAHAFPKHKTLTFLSLALYGALTEALQHALTITRHASLADWIADITGIVLCLIMIRLFKQRPQTT